MKEQGSRLWLTPADKYLTMGLVLCLLGLCPVSHILTHLKNVLIGSEADPCMTVVFQTFFSALVMPAPSSSVSLLAK